jgi:hypothetical protein
LQTQPKKRKCNIQIKTDNKLEVFHATIKPKDGRMFTVFEIVNYMLVNTSTPMFGESTNLVQKFLMDKRVIGFSRATLQPAVKNYNEHKILPQEGSYGIKVGRPTTIDKENIALLNNTLHKNVGMIQGSSSLTQDLLELSSQQRTKRGIDTSFETKTCSSATRKLYNLEASTQPGISLVKPSSTKVTGSRRQTAATLHRNVMSQIATLLNFNFVRGLMRPVATDHIANYNFTSHYYCKLSGVTNYRDLKDE